ncbi:MAG: hypothetical protein CMH52_13695 [Myxococcales bacterium]|nr:hypothetical protein [Myxococcales bacterium]
MLATEMVGCHRSVLKPVQVGTYALPAQSQMDGSTVQPGQPATCDDAVSLMQKEPALEALNRAAAAMNRSLADSYARFGDAELRYRHNLSQRDEFRTSLRWRPPSHSQAQSIRSLQEASERASAAESRMRRALLNSKVRNLHVEYRLASLAQKRAKLDLDTYTAQLTLQTQALEAGTITRADLQTARLVVSRARLTYSDATHELSLASARFVSLTNAKPQPGQCTLVTADVPLADHPEVRLAIETANQQRARADRDAAEAGGWPTYLQTSWRRSDNAVNDQFLLELGIPLLGGNKEQAALALGEARILNARAQWVASQVAAEVKMARAAVKSRQEQVKSARKNLVVDAVQSLGNPVEQARFKRLKKHLEFDVERLTLLVERAQIQLKLALGEP